MTRRGVAPVVGVTVMVLVTVVLAALVGGMFFGIGFDDPPEAAVTVEANYDGSTGQTRIGFTHVAGDVLSIEKLTIRVSVNGKSLKHQPHVPFFSATGFESGPTKLFNSKSADSEWNAGERASFKIAGSNDPIPKPGDEVTVRLFSEDHSVTVVRTVVE